MAWVKRKGTLGKKDFSCHHSGEVENIELGRCDNYTPGINGEPGLTSICRGIFR